MNNIKTIADFKRAMTVGSSWEATHRFTNNNPTPPKSLGVRKCGLNNTVDFGFETDHDTLSYCKWPKKKEFSTEDNGNIVVITTDFCELKYREVN